MKLIPDGLYFDFVGKRNIFGVVSILVVSACLGLFFFVGPNWGIDFTGGTQIRIKFDQPVEIAQVRESLKPIGFTGDAVQQYGRPEEGEFNIRTADISFGYEALQEQVQSTLVARYGADWIQEVRSDQQVGARVTFVHGGQEVPITDLAAVLEGIKGVSVENGADPHSFHVKMPPQTQQIQESLSQYLGGTPFQVVEVETVGPKVGAEMRTQAAVSIAITLVLIFVYVAFRFELAYAPGAFLSLVHDAAVILGAFVIFRREFDLNAIGVILTTLGYSINDTIVIYDRIRENRQKYRRMEMDKLINDAINEMLGRTIATNFTVFLGIVAFLFWGGPTIQTFALAMIVGIITGTYSTIYVASSVMLSMQDAKPWFDKLMAVGKRGSPEAAATGTGGPAAVPQPMEDTPKE